jgi:membrane protein implicated in regulation of membrane protease activity
VVSFYPGQKANELAKAAQERYERAVKKLKRDEEATNKLAEEYRKLQFDVIRGTIGRFVAFVERTGRKASETEKRLLEGMDFSVQQLKEYKAATIGAEKFFEGGVKAAGAAAAGYGGAITVATSIGAASTGTAISSLSGAAATNAMLAWFGGGAIAAGGGGMALGTVVLGGITVLPALAIGGFFAAREGEKAMTKAREHEAKVNKAIAEINLAKDAAQKVKKRITELHDILLSVDTRAVPALNELESQPFDSQRDGEKFQQVAMLMKALVEILNTPALNSQGKLNLGTVTILDKYRILPGK